jgi:hypothetical protein
MWTLAQKGSVFTMAMVKGRRDLMTLEQLGNLQGIGQVAHFNWLIAKDAGP